MFIIRLDSTVPAFVRGPIIALMSPLLVKTYPQPDSLLNSGKQGEAPETAGGALLGAEPTYTLDVQAMSWKTYQPPSYLWNSWLFAIRLLKSATAGETIFSCEDITHGCSWKPWREILDPLFEPIEPSRRPLESRTAKGRLFCSPRTLESPCDHIEVF